MEVLFIATAIIGLLVVLMGFNIFFRKKEFPNSHVSHNVELNKRGIICAKAMDRIEQQKVKDELRFKSVKFTR